jgi:hypothetical protein
LAQQRAREALPYFQEALALRQRDLASGHWRIAEAQSELALCLAVLGESEAARTLLRESLATLQRTRGEDDPITLRAAQRLAAIEE